MHERPELCERQLQVAKQAQPHPPIPHNAFRNGRVSLMQRRDLRINGADVPPPSRLGQREQRVGDTR